jgi:hypothetical protein
MIHRHPKLSVIIVTWNVREFLDRALASVYASWGERPGLDVIVVDNASRDGTVEMVRSDYPQVRLIANRDNRGFTGGNNQGLAAAHGDYLLLLNADTEVRCDALARLVTYLEEHPDVGLVAPHLLNPDGTTQSSRRRFPTLPTLFLESTWLQGLAPHRLLARYYIEDRPVDVEQTVDWVTGAAMMVRRDVVDDVGGLDEGFFMYSEELDWCRRIHAAGWTVAYIPTANIVHYGGKSSEQVATARHLYFQTSKIRYTRKYHGAFAAGSLRWWLMTQYAWQLGVEAIKWLVGHRRELRAARIRAYQEVLASRLSPVAGLTVPATPSQPDPKESR